MSVSAACSPFLLRAFAVMNDVAYLTWGNNPNILQPLRWAAGISRGIPAHPSPLHQKGAIPAEVVRGSSSEGEWRREACRARCRARTQSGNGRRGRGTRRARRRRRGRKQQTGPGAQRDDEGEVELRAADHRTLAACECSLPLRSIQDSPSAYCLPVYLADPWTSNIDTRARVWLGQEEKHGG